LQFSSVPSAAFACFYQPRLKYLYTLGFERIFHPSLNPLSTYTFLVSLSSQIYICARRPDAFTDIPSSLLDHATTKRSPDSPNRNGCPGELYTQLQGHQVGYHAHPMELLFLPLGTAFIRLRMSELQAQDLPALCSQVIGELIHPLPDPGAIRHPHAESCRLTCDVECQTRFKQGSFQDARSGC
jgi:hypothetical protein